MGVPLFKCWMGDDSVQEWRVCPDTEYGALLQCVAHTLNGCGTVFGVDDEFRDHRAT